MQQNQNHGQTQHGHRTHGQGGGHGHHGSSHQHSGGMGPPASRRLGGPGHHQPSRAHPPQNLVGKNYNHLQHLQKPQTQSQPCLSVSDTLSQRLSENVGLACLDKNFDKIESLALNVLTDVMKDFALEIAGQIKQSAEVGFRAEPNMIDALNASYEYGYNKQTQMQIMSNSKLNLLPYKQQALEIKQKRMNDQFNQQVVPNDIGLMNMDSKAQQQFIQTLPPAFLKCAPSSMAAFSSDGKEVRLEDNMSYERMQKIQSQREVQNSIAQVAQAVVEPNDQVVAPGPVDQDERNARANPTKPEDDQIMKETNPVKEDQQINHNLAALSQQDKTSKKSNQSFAAPADGGEQPSAKDDLTDAQVPGEAAIDQNQFAFDFASGQKAPSQNQTQVDSLFML